MKNLITIIIMLVTVGCGKSEAERLEESVAGSYELKFGKDTFKLVILQNGQGDGYINGKKTAEATWKIAGKELHNMNSFLKKTAVYKIEPNADLTVIATIEDGKRTDLPKEDQFTYKNIQ